MQYEFLSIDHARAVTRGTRQSVSLAEYYDAWQFLYDHEAPLEESEYYYLQKLIADGAVITPENHEELGGIPYRGPNAMGAATMEGA